MRNKSKFWHFLIPIIIWLGFFSNFYHHGELKVISIARDLYYYTEFYLNNFIHGEYTFWNPFSNWGKPDDFIARVIGEFNPFLYLILFFKTLGCSFPLAYFIYLQIYFLVGMWGFYLLAFKLFQHRTAAYFSFIALLFSSLTFSLPNELITILIFVPSIWFFYFLAAFTQSPSKKDFLGITFSLMILDTTYMPFHFLTILLCFLFLWSIIYFNTIKSTIKNYAQFIVEHKLFVSCCTFTLGMSAVPGLVWYLTSMRGESIVGWRPGLNPMEMNMLSIDYSSVARMGNFQYFLNNLDELSVGYFYISIFVFIVIVLAAGCQLNRQSILLFSLALLIFLISLGAVTPIHPFLYKHIFFFKYFRNLHIFLSAFAVLTILYAAQQMQTLVTMIQTNLRNIRLLTWIICAHLLCFLIVALQWRVLSSTYITILSSLIFFLLIYYKRLKSTYIQPVMAAIILIQPIEVFIFTCQKLNTYSSLHSASPYTLQNSKPIFKFVRPTTNEEIDYKTTDQSSNIKNLPEFDKDGFTGTVWSCDLHQHLNDNFLKEYVRHKFALYSDPYPTKPLRLFADQPMAFLDHNMPEFQILEFGLNHIKFITNFPQSFFLVYNDNYTRDWHGTINGKPLLIQRSNLAFKGMTLPSGVNTIELWYKSKLLHIFYKFLLGTFFVVFFILLSLSLIKLRGSKGRNDKTIENL